jgi:hypothetical protein
MNCYVLHFVAIINGIAFLIYMADNSLLAYSNGTDYFDKLILYPTTLWNLLGLGFFFVCVILVFELGASCL